MYMDDDHNIYTLNLWIINKLNLAIRDSLDRQDSGGL